MTTPRALIGTAAARGAALFLGVMTLIGVIGELRGRTSDLSLWWIDLRDLDHPVRLGLLVTFATVAIAWAGAPRGSDRGGRIAAVVFFGFGILAVRDVTRFYDAANAGLIRPAVPVPLSLLIAVGLAALGLVAARGLLQWDPSRRRRLAGIMGAAVGWAVVFPIAQMLFFGTTDYRRPADVVVVFGARVYATGQPSPLLADRIRTAVNLYRAGIAPILIMSGGDGTDGFNEARVMRDVAIADGVDPKAIIVDPSGDSTEATVTNVEAILAARTTAPGDERVIVVSQAYHLPRIQLAFSNVGRDVLTVPATERQPIRELPLLMLREVPAFWAYYVRICLG